jgi:hypothetical protein
MRYNSDGDGKVDGGAGAVMGRPVGQATRPVLAGRPVEIAGRRRRRGRGGEDRRSLHGGSDHPRLDVVIPLSSLSLSSSAMLSSLFSSSSLSSSLSSSSSSSLSLSLSSSSSLASLSSLSLSSSSSSPTSSLLSTSSLLLLS